MAREIRASELFHAISRLPSADARSPEYVRIALQRLLGPVGKELPVSVDMQMLTFVRRYHVADGNYEYVLEVT